MEIKLRSVFSQSVCAECVLVETELALPHASPALPDFTQGCSLS